MESEFKLTSQLRFFIFLNNYIYNVENPKQIEIIGYITRNEKSIDFYEVQGAEYKLYGDNYLGDGH